MSLSMPHDVTDHTRTEKKRVGLLFIFLFCCSWPCDVTSALFRQISDSAITLICCDWFVVYILILYRNRCVVYETVRCFFICTDLWCLLLSGIPVSAHPINGYYPVISNTPLLTYMGRIRETRHGKYRATPSSRPTEEP